MRHCCRKNHSPSGRKTALEESGERYLCVPDRNNLAAAFLTGSAGRRESGHHTQPAHPGRRGPTDRELRHLGKLRSGMGAVAPHQEEGGEKGMKGSIIIVSFFLLGILCGVYGWIPSWIIDYNFYVLCALLLGVGLSIGTDPDIVRRFRALNPQIAWLPLFSIAGSLAGSAAAAALLGHRSLTDILAVGSGFGYYSLSSILITEYSGAELGTMALLANIVREILTLLGAPLLVRAFGTLAPIAAGGATAMDTTLPIITQTAGKQYVPVSIYCGFVTDFSVPFLVTMFCHM